jgi:tetratricopeptide (TPR) repeat protein
MIWEYKYMIEHSEYVPKSWAYLKVMHLELGNARMLEKKPAEAFHSYEAALRLDPGYERAHVAYVDLLKEIGKPAQALAQASEGIRHNPNSKPLKRRYRELGGKPPYPEPYKNTLQEDRAANDEPAQRPDRAKETDAATADTGHAVASEPPKPSLPVLDPAAAEPKNSANPYCRFCP